MRICLRWYTLKAYSLNKTNDYITELRKVLPGGVHSNFRYTPNRIKFKSGKASRLLDYDGNEYLDLFARSGAGILGVDNEIYHQKKEEIKKSCQLSSIDYLCSRAVLDYTPGGEMIRYGLSGTETVKNALRLARAFTGKKKVIKFEGNFHGSDENVLGGCYHSQYMPEPYIDMADAHISPGSLTDALQKGIIVLKWNDVEILRECVSKYHNEIAAIITEPIAVNAGSIMPKKSYLETMRQLCDTYGIVLIFDEIITGNRVQIGSIQNKLRVIADLTIYGKALGGGELPVTALVGSREIMNLYDANDVIYGGTFNGYSEALCSIYATIEILKNNSFYEEARKHADRIYTIFVECAKTYQIPLTIQGDTMCASFHCISTPLDSYDQWNNSIIFLDSLLRDTMQLYGIYCASVSRMYPTISINEKDVSFFERRIESICRNFLLIQDRVLNSKLKTNYKLER